jgi:hypothetical protein
MRVLHSLNYTVLWNQSRSAGTVVEVEAAAADGEGEVALGGLALLEDGRGGRGCDERRGRGGEGGDEHHFRVEPVRSMADLRV